MNSWVGAYFCILSVEMAYGKHIVGPHLGFTSPWGPTLYSNSLSLLPMAAIGLAILEDGGGLRCMTLWQATWSCNLGSLPRRRVADSPESS